jgi:GDP/UDP-N,N'-diacetylbacillosamine 2-epimerase (hydrolysing)
MVVTGSRGEYGYLRRLLRLIEARDDLEHDLVVTNMHLLPEFGASVNLFREDGFRIGHELYMALDGSTTTSMSKSLGIFLLSVTDAIHNGHPDMILLAGDRGEQLMAALAGAHMNIPVAHIQAGERSGNIDGMTRHAIARFAHVHFAANQDAMERLIRSGEQEFRVHVVGAPQLDEFLAGEFASADEVTERFRLDARQPIVLLLQHSVTEQAETAAEQVAVSLRALAGLGLQTVLIYPNNDAGSALVRDTVDAFRGPWLRVERNVSRALYGGLLRVASVILGNSSSGLLEAPSFELPAVNVGRRQDGRVRAVNVIDVPHDEARVAEALRQALDPGFRAGLRGMANPYGDGHASERIVEILASMKLDETLLFKQLRY